MSAKSHIKSFSGSLVSLKTVLKLFFSSIFGFCFFLLPIPYQGQITVIFDIVTKQIMALAPGVIDWYCLLMVCMGGVVSFAQFFPSTIRRFQFLGNFSASKGLHVVRMLAVPLSVSILIGADLGGLLNEKTVNIIWKTLILSVGVIIPVGGAFLNLWVSYGVMELVGILMEPSMRRLFRLPGRSAVDNLASWLGSYSVGLYLTKKMLDEGFYTRREAYTMATCFSTVSIGFVGVVVVTLNITHLFLWVFFSYFISIYLLAAILVRTWPISAIPDQYVNSGQTQEKIVNGNTTHRFKMAWDAACEKAAEAPPITQCMLNGFFNGCFLTAGILGVILVIGFCSLVVVDHTHFFQYISEPLVPMLKMLGIPDAVVVAPAVLAGIGEMFVPSLMVAEASVKAKFFIATLSVSQLIFFSSCAPMILSMFRKIPVTFTQLVALFVIRTALLIPLIALIASILEFCGVIF